MISPANGLALCGPYALFPTRSSFPPGKHLINRLIDLRLRPMSLQDQIDKNRAKVRVAADLSGEGVEEIRREASVEKAMADDALREFEVSQGLATPETTRASQATKELGPAAKTLAPLPEI